MRIELLYTILYRLMPVTAFVAIGTLFIQLLMIKGIFATGLEVQAFQLSDISSPIITLAFTTSFKLQAVFSLVIGLLVIAKEWLVKSPIIKVASNAAILIVVSVIQLILLYFILYEVAHLNHAPFGCSL